MPGPDDEPLDLNDPIVEVDPLDPIDDEGDGDEGDAVDLVIEGEDDPLTPAEPAHENSHIRQMRDRIREQGREIVKLRASAPAPAAAVLPPQGPRPSLEGCEWDEDKYAAALLEWNGRGDAIRRATEQQAAEQQRQNDAWREVENAHRRRAAKLRLPDYDDVEDDVASKLTLAQRAVIMQGADNSEAIIYALGKRPAMLEKLAKIDNLAKFTFAVAQFGKDIKMVRRAPPPPAETIRGTAAVSAGASNKRLERLEEEADRTGDRTKVVAYKREMKARAAR